MTIMHSLYRQPGVVNIDESTCKQCFLCAGICPADVLTEKDGRVHISDDSPFGCIACGHCMMVCPENSISVTGRGISPDDLMSLPRREDRATVDALEALLRTRRSVRRFKDQEVAPDLLQRIEEMAASAPMGIPPWDVGCVTVRGREKVQELASGIIKGYEGFLKIFKPWVLSVMRPFVGRPAYEQFRYFIRPLAKMYVDGHANGRDALFYNAPVVLIFHHSPYAETADAAIACTYAMLAAESLDLGSTIIGGAAPVLQRNKALCKTMGIPAGNTPALALILGHPSTHFKRTIRRRFAEWGASVD